MNKTTILTLIEGQLLEQALERDDADAWFDNRAAEAKRWLERASEHQWHSYDSRCSDAEMAQRFFDGDEAPFAQEIAEEQRQAEERHREREAFRRAKKLVEKRRYATFDSSPESQGARAALDKSWTKIAATHFKSSTAAIFEALQAEQAKCQGSLSWLSEQLAVWAELASEPQRHHSTREEMLRDLLHPFRSHAAPHRGESYGYGPNVEECSSERDYDYDGGGECLVTEEIQGDFVAVAAWAMRYYESGVVALSSLQAELLAL